MYKNVLCSRAIQTFHVQLVTRTPVTALKQELHMFVVSQVVLQCTEISIYEENHETFGTISNGAEIQLLVTLIWPQVVIKSCPITVAARSKV
jgi:hypothetical protein